MLDAKLLFKMFVDRRVHRGLSEFSFCWKIGHLGYHRIGVISREGNFRTTLMLRRGTSDLATFSQVFLDNSYNLRRLSRSDEIKDGYEKICRKATPLILDLGANVGLASLYFAKNWPKAHIIAVEPSEQNCGLLRQNLRGQSNVVSINAAVASKDKVLRISNPTAAAWAYRTENSTAGTDGVVRGMSIRSIMDTVPAGQKYLPFIAKIDIEGFEDDLFSEEVDWIRLFPIIIIELHDWMLPKQGSSRNFLRAIGQCDRDFVYVGENVFSIAYDIAGDHSTGDDELPT